MIELSGISYSVQNSLFGANSKILLSNINCKFGGTGTSAILGQTGSGKTTLAKIIAGMISPTSGVITFTGQKSGNGRSTVRLLFQNNRYLLNPNRKLAAILRETMRLYERDESEPEIKQIFEKLGISMELISRYTFQLSGGELQRASIANLLLSKPEVLILDEPFSAQDPIAQKNMRAILIWLKEELGVKLIVVSHKIRILKGLCDDYIILDSGRIIDSGSMKELFESPKSEFAQKLLQAEKFNLK